MRPGRNLNQTRWVLFALVATTVAWAAECTVYLVKEAHFSPSSEAFRKVIESENRDPDRKPPFVLALEGEPFVPDAPVGRRTGLDFPLPYVMAVTLATFENLAARFQAEKAFGVHALPAIFSDRRIQNDIQTTLVSIFQFEAFREPFRKALPSLGNSDPERNRVVQTLREILRTKPEATAAYVQARRDSIPPAPLFTQYATVFALFGALIKNYVAQIEDDPSGRYTPDGLGPELIALVERKLSEPDRIPDRERFEKDQMLEDRVNLTWRNRGISSALAEIWRHTHRDIYARIGEGHGEELAHLLGDSLREVRIVQSDPQAELRKRGQTVSDDDEPRGEPRKKFPGDIPPPVAPPPPPVR